ncbi:prolyl oligopeptidase family serine peptidase [Aquabacterium sp. A7-Y]|uniref:alpha/beta hydrolase family esterase n=1 Tax=Aquabacterium sp. A7-Y TaxID=1349605 RepID=UPI00223C98C3|nr:PHB depolymerase family esterase [Aquabacterium sp. A7-Y]MCW7540909.1 prolyl oligopeptidase family serine peptidase [Aquabacterium sp. A7-Y]
MKRLTHFALVLFTCSLAFVSSLGAAQDGPLRQRLKERSAQRQLQAAGRDLGAEAEAEAQLAITTPGDHSFTLRHDGLERKYRVHVPASYNPAVPAPMLVALHGGGGNMDYQADDERYGLITKSEQEGFVAVFPNGYSKRRNGGLATWNAGECCGAARDDGADDVGFIRKMVARLTRQMNIDRERIYATGMSNGGLMSYRLACEMSDVFKAIAAVAGTDNTRRCAPQHPVAVLHIHALNDPNVLFNGGAGPGGPYDESQVTHFTSVPDTVAKWVGLNGCHTAPRRVLQKPGAYCELYAPCQGRAQVQLCVTETGGHSWPGAQKTRHEPASQAISANDVMWDFFKRR